MWVVIFNFVFFCLEKYGSNIGALTSYILDDLLIVREKHGIFLINNAPVVLYTDCFYSARINNPHNHALFISTNRETSRS